MIIFSAKAKVLIFTHFALSEGEALKIKDDIADLVIWTSRLEIQIADLVIWTSRLEIQIADRIIWISR